MNILKTQSLEMMMQNLNDELFNDYHAFVKHTQKFPVDVAHPYLIAGLLSEAGEVAGVWKRMLRGDYEDNTIEGRAKILDELGDILWYITSLCLLHESTLENLIKINTAKLARRLANDTIKGHGDER
jgi:NTP pyrophosphatase (non-canonical NTP hydrolase)